MYKVTDNVMKKYPITPADKADLRKATLFPRHKVMQVFMEAGFAEDFKNKSVTILRNTNFPFQRVVMPNREYVSWALIQYLLADVNIDEQGFLLRLQQ